MEVSALIPKRVGDVKCNGRLPIGVIILSTVRNAARLAVYEDIMIRVKNHQMPLTMRVEQACEEDELDWNSCLRGFTLCDMTHDAV